MTQLQCNLGDAYFIRIFNEQPSAFLVLCGALYALKNGLKEVKLSTHNILSRQQFRTAISYLKTIGYTFKQVKHVGTFITNLNDDNLKTLIPCLVEGGEQPYSNLNNNHMTPPPLPPSSSPTSSFPPYPLSITTPSSSPTPPSQRIRGTHVYQKGEITQKQAWDIACKFGVSFDSVKFCAAQMADWSASGGKRKFDWEATLRNWVRSSLQRGDIQKLHPVDLHLRGEKYKVTGEMK